jgi:hypothetical protein
MSLSGQSSSRAGRYLLIGSLLTLAPLVAFACDYTVRDIGFVAFDDGDFSLIVSGPEELVLNSTAMRRIKDWGIRLESQIGSEDSGWDIRILDREGSHFQLARAATEDGVPNLVEVLEAKLQSPRLQEIHEGAMGTFAQIVFFRGSDASGLDTAKEAALALPDLEPMLPRPISLPVRMLEIDVEERSRERLLMWAAGLDGLPADESAMLVLYGRGRLAGPAMKGDEIQLDEALRQLALVGESCECDTSRDWTQLRRLPLLWTAESSQDASKMLGFDITDPAVIAEVKDVLSRGRRGGDISWPDRLARIVEGYFEGSITGTNPELLTIPPGRASRQTAAVEATVIEGDGWDFEEEAVGEESSLVDASAKEVGSSGKSQLGSQVDNLVETDGDTYRSEDAGTNPQWPWAVGGGALLLFAGFLVFKITGFRNK